MLNLNTFVLILFSLTLLHTTIGQKPISLPLFSKSQRNKDPHHASLNSTIIPHSEAVRRGLQTISKTMTNFRDVQYYATLYIGESDHEMTFMYDTGSDLLWYPLNNCSDCHTTNLHTPDGGFTATTTRDSITYLDGSEYAGVIATDQVSLTDGGDNVTMIVMAIDDGIPDDSLEPDGLMGMSVSASGNAELLVEALYNAGHIPANAFGVDYGFESETSKIIFGGYDTSVVTNTSYLNWVDVQGSFHWEISIDSVKYGSQTLAQEVQYGILDTGTSLTYWEEANGDWNALWSQMTAGQSQ